jgi:peptidoglycan/xylan/chitin deacetylase (PgdA/CDA1 family)
VNDRISILMYHQIGDFAPMSQHRSTYCHYRRFAAQMAYLHRFRCRVMSLDEALRALRGEIPVPPRAVVLTFDDGYENFFEYAHPVLRRYRFPAMVYLIAGMIGRPSEWFAADGRDTPPLMSAERIRQLSREGVDFGSHGMTHAKLARIDPSAAKIEIEQSKVELETLLDREVQHFCYPYGSYNPQVVEFARAAGYVSAVTCDRAAARPGHDPLALPRKAISYGDNLVGFAWKLHVKD